MIPAITLLWVRLSPKLVLQKMANPKADEEQRDGRAPMFCYGRVRRKVMCAQGQGEMWGYRNKKARDDTARRYLLRLSCERGQVFLHYLPKYQLRASGKSEASWV
jgi:hypothetical protein